MTCSRFAPILVLLLAPLASAQTTADVDRWTFDSGAADGWKTTGTAGAAPTGTTLVTAPPLAGNPTPSLRFHYRHAPGNAALLAHPQALLTELRSLSFLVRSEHAAQLLVSVVDRDGARFRHRSGGEPRTQAGVRIPCN